MFSGDPYGASPSSTTLEHNVWTRIKHWFSQIPFGTLTILSFISFIFFLLQCIFNQPTIDQVCLNYYTVTDGSLNLYRLFAYAFFHSDIMHYLFNMMTHVSFGSILESGRFKSSTKLLLCAMIVVFVESILETFVGFFISNVSHYGFGYNVRLGKFENRDKNNTISEIMDGLAHFFGLHECSIGFSGAIFSFLTIVSTDSSQTTNSLFGMISVPSKYYPWILLLVTSFLFPSSSFVGHLFGIISGYVFVFLFERNSMISNCFNQIVFKIENLIPSFIKRLNSFHYGAGEMMYNASGGIVPQFWNNTTTTDNTQSDNGSSYWSKLTGVGRTLGH